MLNNKNEFVSNGGTLPGIPQNVVAAIAEADAVIATYSDESNYKWLLKQLKKQGHPQISFEEFMGISN
jgi:precorrin-6B methylase 2